MHAELNKQLEDARNQVLADATASLAAQDFLKSSFERVTSALAQALPNAHLDEEELCGNGVMRIYLSSKE